MNDANAIAERRKQHIDGFNRQDQDAMASTASEKIVVMAPNTPAVVGLAAARDWWSALMEVRNLVVRMSAIDLFGTFVQVG
jgi:ketosteroid isomerase-like protein